MISQSELFGGIAVLLGALGHLSYIRGIIKGEVKPHPFTWLTWAILTSIAFVAQVAEGGGAGAWVTGATAATSFIFSAIGLKTGTKFITRIDWWFFIAALLSIPPWYFIGNPVWSVVLITIIDAVAFAPTFRKAYFYPQTEDALTFVFSSTKFIFGILALSTFNLATVLYPASLVLANGAFVIMVMLRSRALKVN